MLDFDKIFSRNDSDNIMIVSENAPFVNRFLSPEMKALLNNYTQSAKAKSAGTTQPKKTAKKKDSFLEGFNDPYGEKENFPRQSLAQRMMAQFTNPVQQTPQSPMIKTETPKYALPNIGNSNNNYSEKKVEAPKTELRASPSANTSEDDAFREGFNYYNDKELMFPNTELHAKPKNYGMMFPNTQLHAGSSIKASERDAFLEGLGFSTDKELMFPNTELHASPSKNKSEDDAFLDGFNDPYGEKKKEEKSKWQKVLDGISTGLTAASFIPGLDTFTNLAQIPVDLLRGDFLGAGLDLVGVIPLIGEAADVAKTARTADRIIDGVRAADKVTDGIKAADAVSDGIRVAEATSDGLKAGENLYDAAKTADSLKPYLDALDDPIAELTKMSDDIALKSPIRIPEGATKIVEAKNNGYYQIKYSWTADDGFEYTSRWHTQRPNAPIEQGDTFVVERRLPGVGYGKNQRAPVEQIRIGKDMWVSKADWDAARAARGRGVLTKEQEEILNNGHWKA